MFKITTKFFCVFITFLIFSCGSPSNNVIKLIALSSEGIPKVTLHWDYNHEKKHYGFEVWIFEEGSEVVLDKFITKENMASIKDLSFDINYSFTVKTINKNKRLSDGTTIKAKIPSDKTPPKNIYNEKYTLSNSKDNVVLFWKNPDDKDYDKTEIWFKNKIIAETVKNYLYVDGLDQNSKNEIVLKTRDVLGNVSRGKTIKVDTNTELSNNEELDDLYGLIYNDKVAIHFKHPFNNIEKLEIWQNDTETYNLVDTIMLPFEGINYELSGFENDEDSKLIVKTISRDNISSNGKVVDFIKVEKTENSLKDIAICQKYNLYLKENGDLYYSGEVDNNNWTHIPLLVAKNVKSIDADGIIFSLFLTNDNKLWEFEYLTEEKLNNINNENIPEYNLIDSDVSSFDVFYNKSVFTKSDGSIFEMKHLFPMDDKSEDESFGMDSPKIVNSIEIEAKRNTFNTEFELRDDGTLWAKGENKYGHFGFYEAMKNDFWDFVEISKDVKRYWNKYNRTFIEKYDGSIYAAGDNSKNYFGNGSRGTSYRFIPVFDSLGNFIQYRKWEYLLGDAIKNRDIDEYNSVIGKIRNYTSYSADVNPLDIFIQERKWDDIKFLLETDARLAYNEPLYGRKSVPFISDLMDRKDYEMIEFLVKNGYKIEHNYGPGGSYHDKNLLVKAFESKDYKLIDLLFSADFDVNKLVTHIAEGAPQGSANTLFSLFHSDKRIQELLKEKGADFTIPSTEYSLLRGNLDDEYSGFILDRWIYPHDNSLINDESLTYERALTFFPQVHFKVVADNTELIKKDKSVVKLNNGDMVLGILVRDRAFCITENDESGWIELKKLRYK